MAPEVSDRSAWPSWFSALVIGLLGSGFAYLLGYAGINILDRVDKNADNSAQTRDKFAEFAAGTNQSIALHNKELADLAGDVSELQKRVSHAGQWLSAVERQCDHWADITRNQQAQVSRNTEDIAKEREYCRGKLLPFLRSTNGQHRSIRANVLPEPPADNDR